MFLHARRSIKLAFLLVALLLIISLPQGASAQTKTLRWVRWDADIQVNTDGTFRVREVYEIEFIGGDFTFGYRNIPRDQFESLSDFAVYEGSTVYTQSGNETSNTYYVNQDSQEYVVNWFYPPTRDQTRTFTVDYTVHGGILVSEEVGDRIAWKAVGPQHDFPIESSTVVFRMPPGTAIDTTLDPFYSGDDAVVTISPDASTVTYVVEYIPANQYFEIGVRFPHGIANAEKPAWQDDFLEERTWDETVRPVLNLGLGAVGIVILIAGLGGIYFLWLTAGRDPSVAAVPAYLTEPPSDLPPGLAGTLVDEKADLQDIVATVVDLARRGVIEMEEHEDKFFGITTGRQFTFRQKSDHDVPLRAYERLLVSDMFHSRDEITLADLQEKFYRSIPELQQAIYEETVREGLFPANPKAVRSRYIGLGIAGIVLTLTVGFCAGAGLPFAAEAIVCPFIATGFVSLVLAVTGRAMPAKSRLGAEEAAKWRAFKTYLHNAERYTDLQSVTDQFEKYLPYAIAFGLEHTWINKFSRIPTTPIPRWYIPVGRGYYALSETGRTGEVLGKARGEGAGRDLRGEAVRPGPSLEGMSDRLSGGLSAMSGGLIAMLNSTATTFTSVPSSSGSGGGGFSGGGFSGGGGGGGGGAGFG